MSATHELPKRIVVGFEVTQDTIMADVGRDLIDELDREGPLFEGCIPFRVCFGEREPRFCELTLRFLEGTRVREIKCQGPLTVSPAGVGASITHTRGAFSRRGEMPPPLEQISTSDGRHREKLAPPFCSPEIPPSLPRR